MCLRNSGSDVNWIEGLKLQKDDEVESQDEDLTRVCPVLVDPCWVVGETTGSETESGQISREMMRTTSVISEALAVIKKFL